MTIITYRVGIMAADTAVQDATARYPAGVPKIIRDRNGILYGVSGNYGEVCRIVNAISEGAFELHAPGKGSGYDVLVAYPDGRIRFFTEGMEEHFDHMPYFAIGAGADFAFGAFHAGASAIEAAEAAIRFSKSCGGEVQHIEFHPVQQFEFIERPVVMRGVVSEEILEDIQKRGPGPIVEVPTIESTPPQFCGWLGAPPEYLNGITDPNHGRVFSITKNLRVVTLTGPGPHDFFTKDYRDSLDEDKSAIRRAIVGISTDGYSITIRPKAIDDGHVAILTKAAPVFPDQRAAMARMMGEGHRLAKSAEEQFDEIARKG